MDRLIAVGTVEAANADAAPLSGTPGYATDGNPATNTPATQWPAYQYNAIQEEILGVIVASGQTPDRTSNNQLLKALPLILPSAPAVQLSNLIYALDRQQFLQWQTIGTFTGYASPLVGLFHWGTTTTPRPFEELLIGSTIDSTLAKYKALIAWANVQGLVVSAASWVAGTYNFGDNGDGTIILPDLRNQFIRATGTDVDTANARTIGSAQQDASQKVTGFIGAAQGIAWQSPSGVFKMSGTGFQVANTTTSATGAYLSLDTSLQIRTSTETRGRNMALPPMICL